MRIIGTRHGDRAEHVLETVCRFVLDRVAGPLLLHARLEAATLDHEAVDDAVKDRIVVVTGLDITDEVLDGLGAFSASSSIVIRPWLVCRLTAMRFSVRLIARFRTVDNANGLDDDRLRRHVLVVAHRGRPDLADLAHYVQPWVTLPNTA